MKSFEEREAAETQRAQNVAELRREARLWVLRLVGILGVQGFWGARFWGF